MVPAWTEYTISTNADGARSVFAVDIDGVNGIDVLSASANDNKIAWYENDGRKILPSTLSPPSAAEAFSVYAVDVDGDTDIDVLSASYLDDEIAWYENTAGDGSSWITHIITNSADGAHCVFAIDLDGVNGMDVLSASRTDDTIACGTKTTGRKTLPKSIYSP